MFQNPITMRSGRVSDSGKKCAQPLQVKILFSNKIPRLKFPSVEVSTRKSLSEKDPQSQHSWVSSFLKMPSFLYVKLIKWRSYQRLPGSSLYVYTLPGQSLFLWWSDMDFMTSVTEGGRGECTCASQGNAISSENAIPALPPPPLHPPKLNLIFCNKWQGENLSGIHVL